MFDKMYQDIKSRFQSSWLKWFYQYSALGALLADNMLPAPTYFYNVYVTSWWWNRLFFQWFIESPAEQMSFNTVLNSLALIKETQLWDDPTYGNYVANHTNPVLLAEAFKLLLEVKLMNPSMACALSKQDDPMDYIKKCFNQTHERLGGLRGEVVRINKKCFNQTHERLGGLRGEVLRINRPNKESSSLLEKLRKEHSLFSQWMKTERQSYASSEVSTAVVVYQNPEQIGGCYRI